MCTLFAVCLLLCVLCVRIEYYIGDEGQNKTIMALLGRIDEFRDEAENWTQYHERLEQICYG